VLRLSCWRLGECEKVLGRDTDPVLLDRSGSTGRKDKTRLLSHQVLHPLCKGPPQIATSIGQVVVGRRNRERIDAKIEWRRCRKRPNRRGGRRVRSRTVDGIPGIVSKGVWDLIPTTAPESSRRINPVPRGHRVACK
jgi:hypothetical protein